MLRTDKEASASTFELFKSSVCHRVKASGEIPFIMETLKSGEIWQLYERGQYPEALYLLAMVDFLSRENDLPVCVEYRGIRSLRLSKRLYPQSVLAMAYATSDENAREKSWENAIPEFKRFNIVEGEVRNVI